MGDQNARDPQGSPAVPQATSLCHLSMSCLARMLLCEVACPHSCDESFATKNDTKVTSITTPTHGTPATADTSGMPGRYDGPKATSVVRTTQPA